MFAFSKRHQLNSYQVFFFTRKLSEATGKIMAVSCSFKAIVDSPCSHDRRDQSKLVNEVPSLSCVKDMEGHKSLWSFTGVTGEQELILLRAAIFTFVYFIGLSLALSRTPVKICRERNSLQNSGCYKSKRVSIFMLFIPFYYIGTSVLLENIL